MSHNYWRRNESVLCQQSGAVNRKPNISGYFRSGSFYFLCSTLCIDYSLLISRDTWFVPKMSPSCKIIDSLVFSVSYFSIFSMMNWSFEFLIHSSLWACQFPDDLIQKCYHVTLDKEAEVKSTFISSPNYLNWEEMQRTYPRSNCSRCRRRLLPHVQAITLL